MIPIFICEDDPIQRVRIEGIVRNYIMFEEYDMTLALSTHDPYEILDYMDKQEVNKGVYFLDIDLEQSMNGIQLGAEIRKKDIYSRIIFVTTHSELMLLTFTYKVEAMDYIIKDQLESLQQRIHNCLFRVYEYYLSETIQEEARIKLKINNQVRIFPLKDVLFFETIEASHKVRLHMTNSRIDFYSSLGELEELSSSLVRIHKSYLVNKENIVTIDRKNREVVMSNGETCLASARKFRLLK
ncbi:two-component system, LytTR family, response regulator AgrA [Enterococcus sp. AZ194]|uniref:LytR/AlgR family response regulator transcription factor n=1 Tax=Enterococcus sp. AZ194 TaxID=2774629 RepID=UPI003F211E79